MKQNLRFKFSFQTIFKPVSRRAMLLVACFCLIDSLQAATYYCDPTTGNIANSGSADSPWSTLEGVFAANKTFEAGDIIYLRDGYHGYPNVKGNNAGYVTIQPQCGHKPKMRKIQVNNAQRWIISGLTISPETIGSYEKGNFVSIASSSSLITVQQCKIYSTTVDIANWTATELLDKFGVGISVSGPNYTISGNVITQVRFGINSNKTATGTLITGNTIDGFAADGIRGLSDNSVYEYNMVKTPYKVDDNHDDGFQSWSTDESGKVGLGVVKNVVVRGNMIMAQTDPDQPFLGSGMQGIGCFDGFFENWTVENNVVTTDMWHGITLSGATNCKIVNNTVVKNPLNLANRTPWISITHHKDGRLSFGNIVFNNLTSDIGTMEGTTLSNIIETLAFTSHFIDFAKFDFHLKAGSPAINAGTTTNTPAIDRDKAPRSLPYDIGAYEYGASVDPDGNNSIITVCSTVTDYVLTFGQAAGGSYSGAGVSNGIFNAAIAGPGTHTITNSYTLNGCPATKTQAILVTTCTGIKESEVAASLLGYPNPTEGKLKVFLPLPGKTSVIVRLLDMNGRKVLEKVYLSQSEKFADVYDFKGQAGGLYLLQITTGKETVYKKIALY